MLNLNLFAQDGYLLFETCCQTIWQRKSSLPKQTGFLRGERGVWLLARQALTSYSLRAGFDFLACVFSPSLALW